MQRTFSRFLRFQRRLSLTRHKVVAAQCLLVVWTLFVAHHAVSPVAVAAPPVAAPTVVKSDSDVAINDSVGKDWVRVRYDAKHQPVAMETAIVRYAPLAGNRKAPQGPVTVDLVAAVHIGDAAYYDELNRRFEKYDALLYELVAAEGTVVERGRGTSNAHPLGALQNGMKSLLALDHQLEKIDYTKPNFVHADMSPDQFLEAMKDRKEGFLEMYMRLVGHTLAAQSELAAKGESPDAAIFAALFAEDRPLRLKRVLAGQLAETEQMLTSFGGEEGSVLITERNKAALKVLREQLAAGKQRLAIFYGAGHLADMDRRLREDFGLKPVEITWLTAWDMSPRR